MSTDHLVPLEDRMFTLLKEKPLFTFVDARSLFDPDDVSDKTLYRAFNKLEKSKKIRHVHFANRKKVYTAIGLSQLPTIKLPNGEYEPISRYIKGISKVYSDDKKWGALTEINELPIQAAKLFIIAQMEEGPDQKREYTKAIQHFISLKAQLTNLLGFVESITRHPSMAGDVNYFRRLFTGNDEAVPSKEEIIEFKKWLSRYMRNDS